MPPVLGTKAKQFRGSSLGQVQQWIASVSAVQGPSNRVGATVMCYGVVWFYRMFLHTRHKQQEFVQRHVSQCGNKRADRSEAR